MGQPADRPQRIVTVALIVIPFVIASSYLVLGSGYVLDDWFVLRNAALDGAWRASPATQVAARPGAALLWALQFGVFGVHPLPSLLLMAALNSAAAVLLHRVLLLVVPSAIASVASVLWVLLPTHTSLEAWHGCSNITLSLALGLGALLTALRPGAWRVLAVVLAAAAGLSYEAILPALLATGLLLPPVVGVKQRVWAVAAVLGGGLLAFGWVLFNYTADKQPTDEASNLSYVVSANFSWGIAPRGTWSTVTGTIVLGAMLAVLVSRRLPSLDIRPVERWAMVASVVLLGLGALPFLRYPYAPLGAGDRANYVSAIGGSLALAVLGVILLRKWRPVAVAGAVVLALSAGAVRWERTELWSQAGLDAGTALDEVVARHRDPGPEIVFGPGPLVEENISAFADDSNVNALVELALRTREAKGRLADSAADFALVPEAQRVDLCALSTLPNLDACRPFGPP